MILFTANLEAMPDIRPRYVRLVGRSVFASQEPADIGDTSSSRPTRSFEKIYSRGVAVLLRVVVIGTVYLFLFSTMYVPQNRPPQAVAGGFDHNNGICARRLNFRRLSERLG